MTLARAHVPRGSKVTSTLPGLAVAMTASAPSSIPSRSILVIKSGTECATHAKKTHVQTLNLGIARFRFAH